METGIGFPLAEDGGRRVFAVQTIQSGELDSGQPLAEMRMLLAGPDVQISLEVIHFSEMMNPIA